jgi:hypothetical protein
MVLGSVVVVIALVLIVGSLVELASGEQTYAHPPQVRMSAPRVPQPVRTPAPRVQPVAPPHITAA